MRQNRRQTDLEQKFLAEERESYIGTMSEETKIENKILKNLRKLKVFKLNFLINTNKDKARYRVVYTSPILFSILPKCDSLFSNYESSSCVNIKISSTLQDKILHKSSIVAVLMGLLCFNLSSKLLLIPY